ncbi:hypothetical protein GCM10011583_06730 [Streptomyces camponoticapitis]|uniref:Lipoprotein n=1 Tax=Streptomyces camponoticapitis TaxID=1616125 RepID=A0ABQ2DYR2_9ACTN|nr:hypothetical protein [Streptomyces camponoticapitis]GGJ77963.1 hypothetical protein GCM10011583_06730 [Streptomyces camponoticapitis]
MRKTGPRASAAIAGAAALVLGTGSAAFAGDEAEFDFSVSPEAVAPGGEVTIRSSGCQASTVTVSSGVFETVTLTEGEEKSATVFDDVKAEAEYEITFDCGGVIRSVPLMIKSATTGTTNKPNKPDKPGKPSKPSHSAAPLDPLDPLEPLEPLEPLRPEPRETRPHKPHEPQADGAHKGVKAGIGGSTDGGPNTAGLAVGAAVIAVAIGGAVRLVRSRPVNGS